MINAGVQSVNVDMKTSHVTVKGIFDPKDLVTYISKRAGRHAEMVNMKNQKKNKNGGHEQKEDNNDQNAKKENQKEKDKNTGGLAYPQVPPGLVYAPQLFSDENANACSIM